MDKRKTGPLRHLLPRGTLLPVICTLGLQLLVYDGAKLLMMKAPHYTFETAWDMAIPFLPWTIVIYIGTFLYWAVTTVVVLRRDRDSGFRFLWAHCLSLLMALVFFLLLPTTNTRPTPGKDTLWDWGMGLLYALDTPDNLFPSLHCELSWLCYLALKKTPGIPRWGKVSALVFTLLVFVSTLTTKQHILIDVVGGWVIGEISFLLCGNPKVMAPFYRIFDLSANRRDSASR